MANRDLTAAEIELLGLPTSFPCRPIGWRVVQAELIAYLQLEDGSESEPFDLVPLLAFLQKENER